MRLFLHLGLLVYKVITGFCKSLWCVLAEVHQPVCFSEGVHTFSFDTAKSTTPSSILQSLAAPKHVCIFPFNTLSSITLRWWCRAWLLPSMSARFPQTHSKAPPYVNVAGPGCSQACLHVFHKHTLKHRPTSTSQGLAAPKEVRMHPETSLARRLEDPVLWAKLRCGWLKTQGWPGVFVYEYKYMHFVRWNLARRLEDPVLWAKLRWDWFKI